MYNTLINFLKEPDPINHPGVGYKVTDSSGAPLKPGRPFADAGLDRVVGTLTSKLKASSIYTTAGNLFADKYEWTTAASSPNIATSFVDTANARTPGEETTFTAPNDGTYFIQLVATKGGVRSDPAILTIIVNSAQWQPTIIPSGVTSAISNPLPADIRFSDIKNILQRQGSPACINCHVHAPAGVTTPSVIYEPIDRNNDNVVDATDDKWFYNEIKGRINYDDIPGSILLRHPEGYHHRGGILPGFGVAASGIHAEQLTPGDHNRSYFDMFLNWILNGAPY
jgi:hypothetical protein